MIRQLLYILSFVLVVVISITGSGCELLCDGSDGEPTIALIINEPHSVSKIYALVNDRPGSKIGADNPTYADLPIDMNSESVIYVFEQQGQMDTLEIFYTIKTELESKACGIRVQAIDIEIGEKTTFADVVIQGDYDNTQIIIE